MKSKSRSKNVKYNRGGSARKGGSFEFSVSSLKKVQSRGLCLRWCGEYPYLLPGGKAWGHAGTQTQAVTGGTKDAGDPLNPGLWDVERFFQTLPCRITRTGPKEPIAAKGLVPAPTGSRSRRLKTGVRNAPLDQGGLTAVKQGACPGGRLAGGCESGASNLHHPAACA